MNDDELYKAKVAAVKLMGKTSYTFSGLVAKLMSKGYDEEISHQVAVHYRELGYLDDRDYAERFIMDAVTFKQQGQERIAHELSVKGVDSFVIEDVFAQLDIDFFKVICELTEKRAYELSDEKGKNRLVGFLRRKGFDYDMISQAIEQYTE